MVIYLNITEQQMCISTVEDEASMLSLAGIGMRLKSSRSLLF